MGGFGSFCWRFLVVWGDFGVLVGGLVFPQRGWKKREMKAPPWAFGGAELPHVACSEQLRRN